MLATLKGVYIAIEEEVKSFISWFNSEEELEVKPRKKKHITRDCTPLNQYHYDFILLAHAEFIEHNAKLPAADRLKVQDLTDRLNERFGMYKSTRSYQRIWSGYVKRDDFPKGTLDFEW